MKKKEPEKEMEKEQTWGQRKIQRKKSEKSTKRDWNGNRPLLWRNQLIGQRKESRLSTRRSSVAGVLHLPSCWDYIRVPPCLVQFSKNGFINLCLGWPWTESLLSIPSPALWIIDVHSMSSPVFWNRVSLCSPDFPWTCHPPLLLLPPKCWNCRYVLLYCCLF
jgi:hypothetical protein